jgi:hypothetical protein
MSDQNNEIEPLSDESLEDVSGGICSWSNCSNSSAQLDSAVDG